MGQPQYRMHFNTLDEWLADAARGLSELDGYLQARKSGVPGHGTVEQLEILKKYFTKIRGHVAAGALPDKTQRQRESDGWILVDGWDPADELGARLLWLNHYYLQVF